MGVKPLGLNCVCEYLCNYKTTSKYTDALFRLLMVRNWKIYFWSYITVSKGMVLLTCVWMAWVACLLNDFSVTLMVNYSLYIEETSKCYGRGRTMLKYGPIL